MRLSKHKVNLAVALASSLFLFATAAKADDDGSKKVVRRGVLMGLDPGFALRVDEHGLPLYARMDLRIGGCITPRVQLGADWRMDLLVGGGDFMFDKRHEIGPVVTVFMVRGWFSRALVHLGGFNPWFATVGAQTGYEFSSGKFTGIGFALGADADIPFDGRPPTGYSFSVVLYLTAYDLATRRGRND